MYSINYSDLEKSPIIISTNTNNTSTSVNLVGKNYAGYGQLIAENFLHLLENFASPTAPITAVEGQLWYDTSDTSNKILKISQGFGNAWDNTGIKTRVTSTQITTLLSADASQQIEVNGFKSYGLQSVQTSHAAWVRIYSDASSRADDGSRVEGESGVGISGLITEVYTTGTSLTKLITPMIHGFNNDSPPENTIYLTVTNKSESSQTISVVIQLLQLEQ
jgi:hypothetical protein